MTFDLSWMAWTWQTGLFFFVIFSLILIMLIWSIKAPALPRKGIFFIETTPGDRLFMSLLGSAFICLFWLFFFGVPLWGGLGVSFIWAFCVFRWA